MTPATGRHSDTVGHTVHRQIARMLPPQPCVRSDKRNDQAAPVSKEPGDSEQGVDHSDGVHRASRLGPGWRCLRSLIAHLSRSCRPPIGPRIAWSSKVNRDLKPRLHGGTNTPCVRAAVQKSDVGSSGWTTAVRGRVRGCSWHRCDLQACDHRSASDRGPSVSASLG